MHTFKDIRCWLFVKFHHLRHRHHRFAETNHLIGQGLHAKNHCFLWTWHVLPIVIDIRGQVAKYIKCCVTFINIYFGSLKWHTYIPDYVWDTWICNEILRWAFRLSQTVATNMCLEWISTVSKLSETSSPIKEQDTDEHIPYGTEKKKTLKQTTQELYGVRESCGFCPIPFEKKTLHKRLPCSSPTF